jgi:hypothetical protein
VTSFEHETDVATLQKALRLLALENERLVKLNLELQKALAEAKGDRVEQLELEIAQVGQFEESREIEMVERRFVDLHHKRKKYRCKCGGCIETAPAPLKLMPGGRYSIDIAISIVVGKYGNHMPLERTAQALGHHGLVIDSQTLWDQINALARIIAPVHDAEQRVPSKA